MWSHSQWAVLLMRVLLWFMWRNKRSLRRDATTCGACEATRAREKANSMDEWICQLNRLWINHVKLFSSFHAQCDPLTHLHSIESHRKHTNVRHSILQHRLYNNALPSRTIERLSCRSAGWTHSMRTGQWCYCSPRKFIDEWIVADDGMRWCLMLRKHEKSIAICEPSNSQIMFAQNTWFMDRSPELVIDNFTNLQIYCIHAFYWPLFFRDAIFLIGNLLLNKSSSCV